MTVDTAKLRELIAKATPGPWTWKQVGTYSTPGCALFWPDESKGGIHYRRLDSNGGMTEADAELITHAVRALPALLDELEDYRDTGAQAVRWAPSSAHWSNELRRLFGDDAREGIDLAEQRLRDAQAEIERKDAEVAKLVTLLDEHDALIHDIGEYVRISSQQAEEIERKDAEVARLREALRSLIQGYVNTLEFGRERIKDLGGDCDPVDVMEAGDPHLRAARAALSHIKENKQ